MNQKKDIDQDLLHVIEMLDDPKPETYRELADDEHLLELANDNNELKASLRGLEHPVDVEAELSRFHARMDEKDAHSRRSGRLRLLWTVVAAAAVLLLVFLLRPQSDLQKAAPGTVYTAQSGQGVELQRNGAVVGRLSAKKSGVEAQVSAADYQPNTNDTSHIVLTVPYGQTAQLELPDGSTAYLHTGSQLVFPAKFRGDRRQIELQGEAYFKVRHDARHPFIVKANGVETRVLGTEFDIDATKGKQVAVTLITGSVAVSTPEKQITIEPGHQAQVENGKINVKTVDVARYTNWRDGYFYFDNIPLGDILTQLGQNYNTTVQFKNQKAMSYRTHFVAPRTASLQEIITTINRMGKVKLHVSQEGVLVVE